VQGRIALHESSHMDVNAWATIALKLNDDKTGKLPSMALDTRVPASMTMLRIFRKNGRLKHRN
jgi:hypothetical protein